MVDRVAEFKIAVSPDDADLRSFLGSLRTQFNSAISDISATARKVTLFEGLEKNVADAAAALAKAKQDVTTFTGALEAAKGAGKDVTKDLQTSLAAAQKATTSATTEYNRQVDSLSKLQGTLSRAGVDTGNLAAAQAKLAEQSKNATNAAANQAAQQLLGLKTVRDTTPEIQKLYAAYNTLAVQGGLSAKELAIAHTQLEAKVAELRSGVTGVGVAAKQSDFDLAGLFKNSILPALGITATIGTVVAGIKSVVDAGKEFRQGLAELSTVSNLTQEQIGKLGTGVRELARDLGVDVNDALKQTAALLRSGVSEDNVLDVLRVSAVAAKASVTDLSAGVKAADLLISGLGIPVADLGRSLDLVVQGAKDGGITLKEFADNGGQLVNIARAANVPLIDLVAALKVMVNAGLDAGTAVADLGKIIAKLQTEEARDKLRSLGIETTNLVEVFQQLGVKGLSIDKVLDLGVASTKSASAIAALTNNSRDLGPELERLGKSAGIAQTQLDGLIDSPKERTDRFNAAWEGFKLRLSETIGTGSSLARVLTDVLNAANDLSAATHGAADEQHGFIDRELAAIKALFGFSEASAKAKTDTEALTTATTANTEATRVAAVKTTEANNALTAASAKLLEQVTALQSASAKAIADVNQVADNQLALLDKSGKAIAATTAATILIQQEAADKRLKIITDNEAAVTKATDAAIEARIVSLKAAGKSQADIETEITKIRLASLNPILAQYQEHYNKLIAQTQAWATQVSTIEESRIAFNRDIEKTLFDLRIGGLSAFDQYLAKVKEVERLIAEARTAGAQGNIKEAENFTKQAIALAQSIGTVVGATGVQVVTQLQAQETKVGLVKKAADALNQSYTESGDAARTGQVLAEVYQGRALANLVRMELKVDELNTKVAEGVKFNIELNEEKVRAAQQTLDEFSKDRTVTITVNTVQGTGGSATGSFARGGPVGKLANVINTVRGYAGGGSVFRDPTWTKVPGSGNQDTVPARLSIGSFVMRKAASMFYGDAAMNRLARGYATGGGVSFGSLLTRAPSLGSGGGHYTYPDPRWVDNWKLDPGDNATEAQQLQAIKGEADNFFAKLLEFGYGLPHSPFGDLSDYIRRAHDQLNASSDPKSAFTILSNMKAQADSFITTFRASQLFHVPAVQPVNAVGLDDLASVDYLRSVPFASLTKFEQDRLKAENEQAAERKRKYGFAGGGGVGTDTVPAYLTPGEFVLKPRAVANIARMFGGGLLGALNSLKVPRGFLDNIANISPPRPIAFAGGGLVPGGPAFMAGGGSVVASGPGGDVHIHMTELTEQSLNTVLLPWLNRKINRSR